MVKADYTELVDIINKYYIEPKDISKLANCNIKYARVIAHQIMKDMKDEGKPIRSTRPLVVPTNRVLKYLDIDTRVIRAEAKKKRAVIIFFIVFTSLKRSKYCKYTLSQICLMFQEKALLCNIFITFL